MSVEREMRLASMECPPSLGRDALTHFSICRQLPWLVPVLVLHILAPVGPAAVSLPDVLVASHSAL
jgi:hypothetical protein